MEGISGLWNSKKAIASGVLALAATIFVCIGKMTMEEWKTYTMIILGGYLTAETAHGVTAIIKGAPAPKA